MERFGNVAAYVLQFAERRRPAVADGPGAVRAVAQRRPVARHEALQQRSERRHADAAGDQQHVPPRPHARRRPVVRSVQINRNLHFRQRNKTVTKQPRHR